MPPAELQASLMQLASDALSKFDGLAAPPTPAPATQQQSPPAHQPLAAEAHPTPPAPQPAPDSLSPVVPSQPAAVAVPVVPVAEPQTPPGCGSTEHEEKEEKAGQEGPPAAAAPLANLNSAKAEAKLVKALDYLVAINDTSDNPGQKWFINESILASLTGCFRPAIKKIRPNPPLLYQSGKQHPRTRTRPQPRQSKDQPRCDPSIGSQLQKGMPSTSPSNRSLKRC